MAAEATPCFPLGFETGLELNDYKIVTLTAPGADLLAGEAAVKEWNVEAVNYRKRFEQRVERAVGVDLSFWWLGQLQEGKRRPDRRGRGAIHWHGVCRGVRFWPFSEVMGWAIGSGFGKEV